MRLLKRLCIPSFFIAGQLLAHVLPPATPEGMVLIPRGSFSMGGDPGLMGGGSQSHGTSYPIHEVSVDAFFMDTTEVTNEAFAAFVEATGYQTFAERPLSGAGGDELRTAGEAQIRRFEQMAATANVAERAELEAAIEQIRAAIDGMAGAIVFAEPTEAVHGNDITQWWRIDSGANWRAPDGPGSSWEDRPKHPVVNVTREDAAAYAAWVGKRLPTEAEWERAARGGLDRQPYVWGEAFWPNGEQVWMANIWQGVWPYENSGEDGFVTTAPVGSFEANAYGLYDMAGNVWEIVADRYHPRTYALRDDGAENPTGPSARDLARLRQRIPIFVTRGGSFLCSDDWCRGYQPGSRQSQELDSPAHHTGFRCVQDLLTVE